MRALIVIVVSTLAGIAPAFGQAQKPDDLEPGVNTSAMPAAPASAPANAKARAVGAQVEAALAAFDRPGTAVPATPAASAAAPAGTPAAPTTAAVPAPTNAPARTTAVAATPKSAKSGKAMDRIDLDTSQITGNKELPKVMYVVPWKRADLGDLTGKPANSLVDEALQPVDRDVFNREQRYYHTVAPEKSPADASAAPAAGH